MQFPKKNAIRHCTTPEVLLTKKVPRTVPLGMVLGKANKGGLKDEKYQDIEGEEEEVVLVEEEEDVSFFLFLSPDMCTPLQSLTVSAVLHACFADP